MRTASDPLPAGWVESVLRGGQEENIPIAPIYGGLRQCEHAACLISENEKRTCKRRTCPIHRTAHFDRANRDASL